MSSLVNRVRPEGAALSLRRHALGAAEASRGVDVALWWRGEPGCPPPFLSYVYYLYTFVL